MGLAYNFGGLLHDGELGSTQAGRPGTGEAAEILRTDPKAEREKLGSW